MNLLFGCFGAEDSFAGMRRAVESLYGSQIKTLTATGGRIHRGYVRDGALVGVARTDAGFLVETEILPRLRELASEWGSILGASHE